MRFFNHSHAVFWTSRKCKALRGWLGIHPVYVYTIQLVRNGSVRDKRALTDIILLNSGVCLEHVIK